MNAELKQKIELDKLERNKNVTHISCSVCGEKMFLSPTHDNRAYTLIKCTCGHYNRMLHIEFNITQKG